MEEREGGDMGGTSIRKVGDTFKAEGWKKGVAGDIGNEEILEPVPAGATSGGGAH